MANNIPSEVYPFSTQDGKAIPLDIIKPAGLIRQSFQAASATSFLIPEGYEVAICLATHACVLRSEEALPDPWDDGDLVEGALLVYRDTLLTASLKPGTLYVQGVDEDGVLYIQLIEKWAGLALPRQFIRK